MLPTGTVTFLFTDLEGSAQLWEAYPKAMPAAMAQHDAVLRQAVEVHGGTVVKTTGDGLHGVFGSVAEPPQLRWMLSGRWQPNRGAGLNRCGCVWPCTPARTSSATVTITGRPSTAPPA